jgi:hypothetical protein
MSKLKSLLVNSVSALSLALLALSFAFASSPAYADDLEGFMSPSQTIADAGMAVAEGIAVLCHSYGNGAETCVTATVNLQFTLDVDLPTSAANAIGQPAADDAAPPPPLRSVDAIKVEITQSVTIAVAGEVVDEHEEITGSISEPAVSAVEPVLVIEAQASTPGRKE